MAKTLHVSIEHIAADGYSAQEGSTYSVRLASGASKTLSASTWVVPVGMAAAILQNNGARIAREVSLTILATKFQRFGIAGRSKRMDVGLRSVLVGTIEDEAEDPSYRFYLSEAHPKDSPNVFQKSNYRLAV